MGCCAHFRKMAELVNIKVSVKFQWKKILGKMLGLQSLQLHNWPDALPISTFTKAPYLDIKTHEWQLLWEACMCEDDQKLKIVWADKTRPLLRAVIISVSGSILSSIDEEVATSSNVDHKCRDEQPPEEAWPSKLKCGPRQATDRSASSSTTCCVSTSTTYVASFHSS